MYHDCIERHSIKMHTSLMSHDSKLAHWLAFIEHEDSRSHVAYPAGISGALDGDRISSLGKLSIGLEIFHPRSAAAFSP